MPIRGNKLRQTRGVYAAMHKLVAESAQISYRGVGLRKQADRQAGWDDTGRRRGVRFAKDCSVQKTDDTAEPVVIKKYANRRLYNTDSSTYVTLEDLADMVKAGRDFLVYDAKTGEDITRSVLTQIIFEQEGKGQNLLPIRFLRQLIRFYDDNMQKFVPSYLEMSLESLAREQEKFSNQLSDMWAGTPFESMQTQVRKNLAAFEKAASMFSPFAEPAREADKPERSEKKAREPELDALKQQLADMQSKIDALSRK